MPPALDPVITNMSRRRAALDIVARAQDDATGLRVFSAAASQLMAQLAPLCERQAQDNTMEQQGVPPIRGNNTPGRTIHGFDPKP